MQELYDHPFNGHLDLDALSGRFLTVSRANKSDGPSQEDVDDFRDMLDERSDSFQDLTDDELREMLDCPEKMEGIMSQFFQRQAGETYDEEIDGAGGFHDHDEDDLSAPQSV